MQSTASESFARALRNPTVLAMLGSAGVHIILVMISALKPAESQPQRFQIVNLPPKASTNRLATNPLATNPSGSNLPVPNGLPPVSLGDIPQLGTLPDLSTFRLPPSQSSFSGTRPGASPSRIDLNKLRTMDLPQRSFPDAPRPKAGLPTVPNSTTPLQPPETAQLPNVNPLENGPSSPSSSNASQFSASNSKLSSLPSAPFSAREVLGLYGQQPSSSAPPDTSTALSNPSGTESPNGSPSGASPETNSLDPRTKLARVVANQRLSVVQELSIQKGPQLTAAYPLESCSGQKNGSAVVYALYERDGSVSKRSDAIQVLESAPDIAMNQAAIAAVSAYRPEAKGIYQALTFNVDIPYSAAACQAAQPKPSPTQSPKANKKSVSPNPVATPSNLPSASPQSPSLTPTLRPTQPSASPFPSPSQSAPTANPVPSSVSEPSPASPSAPTPEAPSPSPSPSPESPPPSPTPEAIPSAPSQEPVPSPSITVPDGTPAPVTTPSTTP
jgi:hypothetical protein